MKTPLSETLTQEELDFIRQLDDIVLSDRFVSPDSICEKEHSRTNKQSLAANEGNHGSHRSY